MTTRRTSEINKTNGPGTPLYRRITRKAASGDMKAMRGENCSQLMPPRARADLLSVLSVMEELGNELESASELFGSTPNQRIVLHLIRGHLEGRLITMTSLIGASRAPYATANRRIRDMQAAGLIDQRPRTATGKGFSLHPSVTLVEQWTQLAGRVRRLAGSHLSGGLSKATPD